MKFFDLLSLIIENLGRRKGRVILTAVGVIIGTAAVVILVSLATGLQKNAAQQLGGISDLSQITVYPTYGDKVMFGGGGGMAVSSEGSGQQVKPKLLTPSIVNDIKAIPGVSSVIPRDYLQANAMLTYGKYQAWGNVMGVGTNDLSVFDYKLKTGTLKLDRGTAIIGEMMLQNFMDPKARPGQMQPEPPDLQDKQLKLVLTKWVQDGDSGMEVKKTFQIRVVGILAETQSEAAYSMFMNLDDVTTYNEWANGKRINRNRDGYSMLTVLASDVNQILDIAQQITDMGYQANSPQSYVQGINSFFVILQVIFGGIGAISLLVAAIGIANTMAMAILERTREIGLMKAIGATNNNVLSVFLGEAAGIGFIGGLGGVGLGWAAAKVLDVLASSYYTSQAASSGGPPPSVIVYIPLWLPGFALAFATLVGLISGLYPALRAATLVPVTALKYE